MAFLWSAPQAIANRLFAWLMPSNDTSIPQDALIERLENRAVDAYRTLQQLGGRPSKLLYLDPGICPPYYNEVDWRQHHASLESFRIRQELARYTEFIFLQHNVRKSERRFEEYLQHISNFSEDYGLDPEWAPEFSLKDQTKYEDWTEYLTFEQWRLESLMIEDAPALGKYPKFGETEVITIDEQKAWLNWMESEFFTIAGEMKSQLKRYQQREIERKERRCSTSSGEYPADVGLGLVSRKRKKDDDPDEADDENEASQPPERKRRKPLHSEGIYVDVFMITGDAPSRQLQRELQQHMNGEMKRLTRQRNRLKRRPGKSPSNLHF
ncbi:MAG: hypothetical protein M1820_000468 [Bogoriella megaspora]|nr:MAG: hypothetical protein M1820_000468 [Bogoriella megaspora]